MSIRNTQVVEGNVVATGPYAFDLTGNCYSSIQFDDGRVLHGASTDGRLDRFFDGDDVRTFTFATSPLVLLEVVDVDGRSHRVDRKFLARRRRETGFMAAANLAFGFFFAIFLIKFVNCKPGSSRPG